MSNGKLFNSVTELLSHTGEMVLLDTIEDWGEDYLVSRVDLTQDHWFVDNDGNTPSWVGLEYMAQSIGALAGIKSLMDKEPVRIGLLLGTRKFIAHEPYFPKQSPVTIRVDQIFLGEDHLAMFDCKIYSAENKVLAEAQVKAIQPKNIEDIIPATPIGT